MTTLSRTLAQPHTESGVDNTITEHDTVAEIVERWLSIRPDLDPTPMLVLARIQRLNALIDERLRPAFAAARLANGDFDLLAALRRQGPPHEASPSHLATAMLVTTGAASKRIDRLERQGYVVRRPSNLDGRGRIIALTPSGRRLVDNLIGVHLTNEAAILAPLPTNTRHQLGRLLGELARVIEAPRG